MTVSWNSSHCTFTIGVHYMAYWTNLAYQSLSGTHLVSKLETMPPALHFYFCNSPKKYDYEATASLLETKGQKNSKKKCYNTFGLISMLSHAKRVLRE